MKNYLQKKVYINKRLFFLCVINALILFPFLSVFANSWNIKTIDPGGGIFTFYGQGNSIAIDSLGRPHISYIYQDDLKGYYYLKYAFWDGNSWQKYLIGYPESPLGDTLPGKTTLVLDSDDQPHIICNTSFTGYTNCIRYINGATWISENVFYGSSGSLALDQYDRPHISYAHPYSVVIGNVVVPRCDLKYAYWDGASWTEQTIEFGGRIGEESSLALDSQMHPHIAYKDFGTANTKLKYVKWNGSEWKIQIVDEQGFLEYTSLAPSLVLNSMDQPCISYAGESYNLQYAKYDGANWQIQIIDPSVAHYTLPNSLALDQYDRPHISYQDNGLGLLKYAVFDGTGWQNEVVDSANKPGLYNSIALDANGKPHISYWELIRGDLKYATTNISTLDFDGDGISDDVEDITCTNKFDIDSDDDGIADGQEDLNHNGIVDINETDPCAPDTDGDGVQDGTEKGIIDGIPDPDGDGPILGTNSILLTPDADPTSTTDPTNPDSDHDGLLDGEEDSNGNGTIDAGETDPNNAEDTDGDGLSDYIETSSCTNSNDADSDDDGIKDGIEDVNQNGLVDSGETDPCLADSDGDGIQDGTELGYTITDIGSYTDLGEFIPDADPSTTTDPTDSDSDDDGFNDGIEDTNFNGMTDSGETDPFDNYSVPKPTPIILEKLLPSDGNSSDYFGYSVSVSENIALIGAYQDDDNGSSSGSAYIYRWDGSAWVLEQKLLPSDGDSYDYFGMSVSISGDTALIGACRDEDFNYSGSAYIFRWNGSSWVQEQKLVPSDGDYATKNFGGSVSISGEYALIGAYQDDDKGSSSGSAYVYRWDGSSWIQIQKLVPSDGEASDNFGYSVSISGDHALIGAYKDDDNGYSSGSAYIYRWNGSSWVLEQKLLPSDGNASDEFGISVSLSGGNALIGAYWDDDNGSNSGSAYIFHWDGSSWVQTQKLFASDGESLNCFGNSVSIQGERALIGASGDNDNGSSSGSAYIFNLNGSTWVQVQKLLPSDGESQDYWGQSVSISEENVLIGACQDDDNGSSSGSVYTGSLPSSSDMDGDGLLDSLELSFCTNEHDADTDDDGIADGDEDLNHNGIVDANETDPCDPDTDDDGIQDGTEKGVVLGLSDPDGSGPLLGTDDSIFIIDADPFTRTSPNLSDTDGDGFTDGEEDKNYNGALETGETDPKDLLDFPEDSFYDTDGDGDVDGLDLYHLHSESELNLEAFSLEFGMMDSMQ